MKEFKVTVAQVGAETSNGNKIVKLQNRQEVETPLGVMRSSETYYAAVKADQVAVEVGQEIEIDMELFNVTEREFALPETGEIVMLKWLSLRK